MRSTTIAMALLSSVVAADSVTTLFLPFFDQQALVASVIDSNAATTTYSVACAPDTDPTECGAGTGFTLVEGPKTMSLEIVDGDKSVAYADLHCDIDTSASTAACTETIGGSEANYAGTSITTLGPDDYTSAWIPVTITAGALTGAAATTDASTSASTASATTKAAASSATTAASTGTSAAASSGMSTAASSSASSSSTGTASAKASSSAVSTGGMPQITGNAQWAMGGVAVAMALAAL
ncbi:hypothetical protein DPV78_006097 [Talaromyces pinophilus]|nr:hypothetical protein DPV78_006097 [Talaromyces pinophilus]